MTMKCLYLLLLFLLRLWRRISREGTTFMESAKQPRGMSQERALTWALISLIVLQSCRGLSVSRATRLWNVRLVFRASFFTASPFPVIYGALHCRPRCFLTPCTRSKRAICQPANYSGCVGERNYIFMGNNEDKTGILWVSMRLTSGS